MSVHLHHPLTEDVKCVFLVLLPFGAQPLPFGGSTPKEQNGELATPVPRPGRQEIGNGLNNQNGQKYVAAKERESADVIPTGTGHSPVQEPGLQQKARPAPRQVPNLVINEINAWMLMDLTN